MELRLLDESDAVQRSWRVETKTARRAARARHQAESLVIAQGVPAQPALRRQFADPKRWWFAHNVSAQYPPWSALQSQDSAARTRRRLTLVRAPGPILRLEVARCRTAVVRRKPNPPRRARARSVAHADLRSSRSR